MQAAMIGIMRQVTNLRDKRRDAHGLSPDQDGWGIHIEGCCGEIAASKALNVYWSGAHGTINASDIGGRYQVRTRSKAHYRLILHPSDPDDAVFVMVRGRAPTFEVVGWIRGADGKRREWWQDPAGGRPAFFVPDSALQPMNKFPK